MNPEQSQTERLHLLLSAFKRLKILWLPLVVVLPFAFLGWSLFLRMVLSALLLPPALFLHEWFHMLLVPSHIIVHVVRQGNLIAIDFEGKVSAGRNLLIALLPHVVMWGAVAWLWGKDPLLSLPFVLSGLSLPADLHSWYQRSFLHG